MTTNANIAAHVQKPQLGAIVDLFDVDATMLPGGSLYRFAPASSGRQNAVTNWLRRSGALGLSPWALVGATAQQVDGASPHEDVAATLVSEVSGGANHYAYQNVAVQPDQQLCASMHFKPSGRRYVWFYLTCTATGDGVRAVFDLDTGKLVSKANLGDGSDVDAGVARAANGFWRCWVSGVPHVDAGSTTFRVYMSDSPSSLNYAGNGVQGVFMWGGQLEIGVASPSTYVNTSSTTQTISQLIKWRGNEYAVTPIKATGFEKSGTGTNNRPVLSVSNVLRIASSLVEATDELEGAYVTRWRVFDAFLDGAPNEDPNAYLSKDLYIVDRKSQHNEQVIEWELAGVLDQTGVMLPRRSITRDTCPLRYRVWTGTKFDYTKATCPYIGHKYFDEFGSETSTAADDACSHRFDSGCLKRFAGQDIPFGAFPGVARTQ